MRALVTGGAGFIGSTLARKLLTEGWQITILDDLSTGLRERAPSEANFIEGDISNTTAFSELKPVDVVFHFAAQVNISLSWEKPQRTLDVNVTGTKNLLEWAVKNAKRVVFSSSSVVYGSGKKLRESSSFNPTNPYAVSKILGEGLMNYYNMVTGLSTISLRYFNVYGPGQLATSQYAAVVPSFVSRAQSGESLVIFGDGKQSRDFVFVDDVVEANLAASRSDFVGAVNVGSGSAVSINSLAANITKLFGAEVKVKHLKERKGDPRYSFADTSKVRKEIGWKPRVRLRDGLLRTLRATPDN